MVLPLNAYTQWYWKIDLHNLLHFVALRADPHAQYEIRAYAEVLLDVVRRWVPLTYAAFVDYRLKAAELSAKALAVVRRMLRGRDREPGGQRPERARVARAAGASRAGLSVPPLAKRARPRVAGRLAVRPGHRGDRLLRRHIGTPTAIASCTLIGCIACACVVDILELI